MKHRTVEASRTIAAPVRDVWAVLTDLDNATANISAIRKVERLDGAGYEPGVRWRETRKMFGVEASEVMEVLEAREPESTSVGSLSSGIYYTTEFRCEPDGDTTVLTAVFAGEPREQTFWQKIGWAVFGASGMKASRKALLSDLNDIAQVAEAHSTD